MSNLGIYGFPAAVNPRGDGFDAVNLGPRWRDPTTRLNWPGTVGASSVANAEGEVYDLSPGGNTVLPCYLEWTVPLRAGQWAADVFGITGNNYGIAQVWFDGISLGTLDFYTAAAGSFIYGLVAVPVGDGPHTVRIGKTGTKNASSIEYYCAPTTITLHRIAGS